MSNGPVTYAKEVGLPVHVPGAVSCLPSPACPLMVGGFVLLGAAIVIVAGCVSLSAAIVAGCVLRKPAHSFRAPPEGVLGGVTDSAASAGRRHRPTLLARAYASLT